jgi:hypothetical protein
MRVLRTLVGLVLTALAVGLLLAGAAGLLTAGHRDGNGAFTAQLAPVHSEGFAVVVPDVAGLVGQHEAADRLSPGRLRVTVATSSEPLVLVLLPADAARRYLDDVPRTEITAVGFGTGVQPVGVADFDGTGEPAPLSGAGVLAMGPDLFWDTPGDRPMALLVLRTDGERGIDAALTVGIRPGWLDAAVRGLLIGGTAVLLLGGALLLWPVPRETLVVVEARQVVDLADQFARLTAALPAGPSDYPGAYPPGYPPDGYAPAGYPTMAYPPPTGYAPTGSEPAGMRRAPRDLTGELVPMPRRWPEDADADAGAVEGMPAVPQPPAPADPASLAAARAARWRELLDRHNGLSPVADPQWSTVDDESDDRPDGDSPYIYTAT